MSGPNDSPTSPDPTTGAGPRGERAEAAARADGDEGASGADTTHADAAEQLPVVVYEEPKDALGVFGRYLTLWVALMMIFGVLIGYYVPSIADGLNDTEIAHISIPIAGLIWVIVYPMILQVDLASLREVRRNLKPICITSGINYLVQPFTMYALARLFFDVFYASILSDEEQDEYIAGCIILGGTPCTAMVFVWSLLTHGDAAYTLVQVAFNDVLIFIFYIPTMMLLLEASSISVPWDTAFLAVGLFLLCPGLLAYGTRWYCLTHRKNGLADIDRIVAFFKPLTMVSLLLVVLFIFILQGEQIVDKPSHVFLIAVPLTIQSYGIFILAYFIFYWQNVPFKYAAPGSMIATSNFFELAVAVAMSLFGPESGATLATVVGVLVEVPIMLSLCWFANRTQHWFPLAEEDKAKARAVAAAVVDESAEPSSLELNGYENRRVSTHRIVTVV